MALDMALLVHLLLNFYKHTNRPFPYNLSALLHTHPFLDPLHLGIAFEPYQMSPHTSAEKQGLNPKINILSIVLLAFSVVSSPMIYLFRLVVLWIP
jgi:hypothetical protein